MATNTSDTPPLWRIVLRDPRYFVAFGFGAGLSPVAPGTVGTLVAIPFYLLLRELSLLQYVGVLLILGAVGVALCDVTARALKVPDHPGIVFDEMVGYWVTMLFAPPGVLPLLLGFGLFRLFDIWKPWPIRYLERKLPGGWGIMLDDVLAGFYAASVMAVCYAIIKVINITSG